MQPFLGNVMKISLKCVLSLKGAATAEIFKGTACEAHCYGPKPPTHFLYRGW